MRGSFLEAREVADVAVRHPDGRPFYRLPDLRLRGLLHLLRDDARLRAFAGRELGPLVGYDAAHGTSLVSGSGGLPGVRRQQGAGGGAGAPGAAHLLRAGCATSSASSGVSLADPESRTCLHVALLSLNDLSNA